MIVEKKTLKNWKAKREWGDASRMGNKYKISVNAFSRCLLTGRGSKETIAAINDYYGITETKRVLTDIDNVN